MATKLDSRTDIGRLDTYCIQSGEIKVEYAAKYSSEPPVPLIYQVESIRERVPVLALQSALAGLFGKKQQKASPKEAQAWWVQK